MKTERRKKDRQNTPRKKKTDGRGRDGLRQREKQRKDRQNMSEKKMDRTAEEQEDR